MEWSYSFDNLVKYKANVNVLKKQHCASMSDADSQFLMEGPANRYSVGRGPSTKELRLVVMDVCMLVLL